MIIPLLRLVCQQGSLRSSGHPHSLYSQFSKSGVVSSGVGKRAKCAQGRPARRAPALALRAPRASSNQRRAAARASRLTPQLRGVHRRPAYRPPAPRIEVWRSARAFPADASSSKPMSNISWLRNCCTTWPGSRRKVGTALPGGQGEKLARGSRARPVGWQV